MSDPIEAHSITSLTHLATFPSQHRPDFLAASHRPGLLLWILRVPDSNDLLLTPLHPARGAPTASAAEVAASLYYVHRATHTLIRRHPGTDAQQNVAVMLPIGTGEVELHCGGARRVMRVEGRGLWDRLRGRGKGSDTATTTTRRKKRDWVFDSLWSEGMCAFKDEAQGRYLKCKFYPQDAEESSTLLSVVKFARVRKEGRAKLGMLIVHGPGQEMLDLLVAANVVAFLGRWEGWAKESEAVDVLRHSMEGG